MNINNDTMQVTLNTGSGYRTNIVSKQVEGSLVPSMRETGPERHYTVNH